MVLRADTRTHATLTLRRVDVGSGALSFEFLFRAEPVIQFVSWGVAPSKEELVSALPNLLYGWGNVERRFRRIARFC